MEEEQLLRVIEDKTFSIPSPILIQPMALGRVTTAYGEHLFPEFPPLPSHQIGGFGGYFGPINEF